MRSYAMVLLQNNADTNGPSFFSQRDKKGPLDQKKRQALRNRIPFVHDKSYLFFLRFKAEVTQSLFVRIVKISNKSITQKMLNYGYQTTSEQFEGYVDVRKSQQRQGILILYWLRNVTVFFYRYKLYSTLLHLN